jgi:hypothetical protein
LFAIIIGKSAKFLVKVKSLTLVKNMNPEKSTINRFIDEYIIMQLGNELSKIRNVSKTPVLTILERRDVGWD